MRKAITNLIEHNNPERLYNFLNWMLRIMIGLCIALAFALGYDVIQWQHNKRQDHRAAQLQANIRAIQNANHLAALAAAKTCRANKPGNTAFVNALITYFDNQATAIKPLLDKTPHGTQLWRTRNSSYHNYLTIENTIRKSLPIKCPTVGTPKKKAKTNVSKHQG